MKSIINQPNEPKIERTNERINQSKGFRQQALVGSSQTYIRFGWK